MSPPGTPNLAFYATPPHPCSYLPDRDACSVFADPGHGMGTALYSILSDHGFRRSGAHIYRPACGSCRACVPVRVPAARFRPRRVQRRISTLNRGLRVVARPPGFDTEHFALYRRYVSARHPGGGMDDPEPEQYLQFLTSTWSDTTFYEFRHEDTLLAVAVTDRLSRGLSGVYTFFDPDDRRRSLGIYSVLWQIGETSRLGLDWFYLGYWIRDCRKMRYKSAFRPQERYWNGAWIADTEFDRQAPPDIASGDRGPALR